MKSAVSDQICRFRLYTAMLSCEFNPDQCSLLTDNHIHTMDYVFLEYVPPEVHLSHLYVKVTYVTRSKGATLLSYYGGKIAKRGRIDTHPLILIIIIIIIIRLCIYVQYKSFIIVKM